MNSNSELIFVMYSKCQKYFKKCSRIDGALHSPANVLNELHVGRRISVYLFVPDAQMYSRGGRRRQKILVQCKAGGYCTV